VRQQEDDLVTLLRKADFAHVRIAAIEGFVPEEEQSRDGRRAPPSRTPRTPRPADGLGPPAPPFQRRWPLRYRTVPEEALTLLRAEESAESVPRHAARAVAELLRASGQDDLPAVLALALEVRDFLLVERRGDLVAELGRMTAVTLSAQSELAARFLSSYLDAPTIEGLAQSLQPNAETPPPSSSCWTRRRRVPPKGSSNHSRGAARTRPRLAAAGRHAFRNAPQALALDFHRRAERRPPRCCRCSPSSSLRRPSPRDRGGREHGSGTPEGGAPAARRDSFNPELAHALLRLTHSPLEEVRTAAAACLKARRGEHG